MNKQANAPALTGKKKRSNASLDKRKARAGYLFVLPFIISFIIIYLPIIIDSITFSFNSIKIIPGGGYYLEFVGFENYRAAFMDDPNFVQTLTTGIQQLVFDIPAIVIFSLFMAVLLNQKMIGRAAFRAIFFIPVILSTGIIESIDQENMFMTYMNSEDSIETGAGAGGATQIISAMDFENLFATMKVGGELVEYVINLVNNIYNIINRSGVQMLIFLAGLQSISPAINGVGNLLEDHSPDDKPDDPCKRDLHGYRLIYIRIEHGNEIYLERVLEQQRRRRSLLCDVLGILPDSSPYHTWSIGTSQRIRILSKT